MNLNVAEDAIDVLALDCRVGRQVYACLRIEKRTIGTLHSCPLPLVV
jgi:hypothetical protein